MVVPDILQFNPVGTFGGGVTVFSKITSFSALTWNKARVKTNPLNMGNSILYVLPIQTPQRNTNDPLGYLNETTTSCKIMCKWVIQLSKQVVAVVDTD
eukprot:m.339020 g.339020  ORF g.339020 m.339020 type:complete len:98 (+) comp18635_c0_seq1:1337-1630(+)